MDLSIYVSERNNWLFNRSGYLNLGEQYQHAALIIQTSLMGLAISITERISLPGFNFQPKFRGPIFFG